MTSGEISLLPLHLHLRVLVITLLLFNWSAVTNANASYSLLIRGIKPGGSTTALPDEHNILTYNFNINNYIRGWSLLSICIKNKNVL